MSWIDLEWRWIGDGVEMEWRWSGDGVGSWVGAWQYFPSSDCSKAALTKLDGDEYINVITKISLPEREWRMMVENNCFGCHEHFDCECRLRRHFRNHHQETLLKQWNIICPFCLSRWSNKCALLKHIFMEHKERKHLAKEALRERGHCEKYYDFHTVENYCPSCDG